MFYLLMLQNLYSPYHLGMVISFAIFCYCLCTISSNGYTNQKFRGIFMITYKMFSNFPSKDWDLVLVLNHNLIFLFWKIKQKTCQMQRSTLPWTISINKNLQFVKSRSLQVYNFSLQYTSWCSLCKCKYRQTFVYG